MNTMTFSERYERVSEEELREQIARLTRENEALRASVPNRVFVNSHTRKFPVRRGERD